MEDLDTLREQGSNKWAVSKVILGYGAFIVGATGVEVSTLIHTSQNLYQADNAISTSNTLLNYWANLNSEFLGASALLAVAGISCALNGFNSIKRKNQ